MPKEPDSITCSDDTEQIVINIPCRLIERVQKYAKEHGDTITGVVIEALDALLDNARRHGVHAPRCPVDAQVSELF